MWLIEPLTLFLSILGPPVLYRKGPARCVPRHSLDVSLCTPDLHIPNLFDGNLARRRGKLGASVFQTIAHLVSIVCWPRLAMARLCPCQLSTRLVQLHNLPLPFVLYCSWSLAMVKFCFALNRFAGAISCWVQRSKLHCFRKEFRAAWSGTLGV